MGQHSRFIGKEVRNARYLENRQDMLRGTMVERTSEVNLEPIALTGVCFLPILLKV